MSETDPLDTIELAILRLLRRANDPRGNRQIFELAGTDIERAGAVMLARLDDLQPARLSDLATSAGIEVSTASRQVARLIDHGYVEKASDPVDRRAALLRLTPAGVDLRRRLKKAVRSWFELGLDDLDRGERANLADLLSRFVNRLVDETAERSEIGALTSGKCK